MTNIDRIRGILKSNSAALITNEISRRYLTGFLSSDGYVVVTKKNAYFVIDSRYYTKASEAVKDFEVLLQDDLHKQLLEIYQNNGINTILIESDNTTVSTLRDYRQKFPSMDFDESESLSKEITNMRIIKTKEEIDKITAAQRIAERAFDRLLSKLSIGMTEKQVSAILNFYMMDLGADGISFETIAASGTNSACPHAVPTDKPLCDGDFLTLDFGALLDGYHSDMTRTVAIGSVTDEMKRVYDAVKSAQDDGLRAIHADISGKVLDNVSRSTLDAWGYAEYFGHGLGHGVGLQIHEAPNVSPHSSYTLREGMIITIEPGVYIPGKFGVRIEDMAVVTKDGYLNLTNTQHSLIIVRS